MGEEEKPPPEGCEEAIALVLKQAEAAREDRDLVGIGPVE